MKPMLLVVVASAAAGISCDSNTDPPRGGAVLGFLSQPQAATAHLALDPPIRVALQDPDGNTLIGGTAPVTLVFAANPSSAVLSGTTTVPAVQGVATFTDLSLDRPGDGFVLEARSAGLTPVSSVPFSVRLTFVQASAGDFYTCGLTIAEVAYCWGSNGQGRLGDSTTASNRITPTRVAGGERLVQVAAGAAHTCGIAIDSAAYCWGWNVAGQLGDGTTTTRLSPTPVQGTLKFVQVSAAHFAQFAHTCGVATDGAAHCWGGNDFGRLGDGTAATRLVPTPVAGGLMFIEVSAGGAHTCGVTTDSVAYCWGWNARGQLGDGTTDDRPTPTPVAGGLRFAQVSAGGEHTCGLTTDNAVYCWGANNGGQVGDGTTDQRLIPTPVAGGLVFAQVSAGGVYSCGVGTDNRAHCWGDNASGRLGDGTSTPRLTPTLVTGNLSFAGVSAALFHTCGVTTDHVGYCWGGNNSGELGDSTTVESPAPRRVKQ